MLRIATLGILLAIGSAAALADAGEDCERKIGEDAIKACSEVIQRGGNIAWAYYNRGVEQANQGRNDEAIADFTAAIRLRPTYFEAFNNRGIAYENKREFDRALADYSRAIDLEPTFAYPHNNRANIFKARGEIDRAIAEYTRAIEIDATYALAYSNRADALNKKGDYDRAIADADHALTLNPDLADALAARAAAHVGKGDYDRAIADFTRALDLEPDTPAVADLGFAHFYKGNFKEAAQALSRAVDLDGGAYPMIFRYIARTRLGEPAKEELARDARELPDQAVWPLPVIEMFLGTRQPAATLESAHTNEEKCEANFYVGQWYLLEKDEALALRHLQTAAKVCPRTFIERRAANAELKAMGK